MVNTNKIHHFITFSNQKKQKIRKIFKTKMQLDCETFVLPKIAFEKFDRENENIWLSTQAMFNFLVDKNYHENPNAEKFYKHS